MKHHYKKNNTTPTTYTNSHPGCRHWRVPVRVGKFHRGRLTASSWATSPRQVQEERLHPDFGIYLHTGWRGDLGDIWTSGVRVNRAAAMSLYPAMVVDCPDMGVPKPKVLDQTVEIALSKLRQGKWVDVGCNAGHGRTGLILACILSRVEHLTGPDAVREVRTRYCIHAVESLKQEDAVAEYAALHGYGESPARRRLEREFDNLTYGKKYTLDDEFYGTPF